MDEALNRLIDMIQSAAPEVWEVAVKQAIMYGIRDLIWVVIFLICIVICSVGIRYLWVVRKKIIEQNEIDKKEYLKTHDNLSWFIEKKVDAEEGWIYGLAVGIVLFVSVAIPLLIGGVMRLANPGYYAIQMLLDLL